MKKVCIYNPNTDSFSFFQSFYIYGNPWRIKPNVLIMNALNNEIIFETNSYGFKGKEINLCKKLVAIWGDSVVFGVGKGWVEGLENYFPNYQFLNGGLEGDGLENIIQRAKESNIDLNISLNVLFPGWHNLNTIETVPKLIEDFIRDLPNPVLCTVPTSLTEEIVKIDISRFFNKGKDLSDTEVFYFWGNIPYSVENALKIYNGILSLNKIVREMSNKHNIPLVDLFTHLKPKGLGDFRNEFFDIGHPRPLAYSKIQKIFAESLENELV